MEIPDDLIELQRAADELGRQLEHLDNEERAAQREKWFEAAGVVQAAVTAYAAEHDLNRYEVEKKLRQIVRHPPKPEE